jgi:hypothetical protein
MNLSDTIKPPGDGIFGKRFYLVGYFPTYAAALFLLLILWAGARGWNPPADHRIDFATAWNRASSLSIGQALALLVTVTLTAILLQPFQLPLLRFMEGYWPPPLNHHSISAWQRWRCRHLLKRADLKLSGEAPSTARPPTLDQEQLQHAGAAGRLARQRFPLPAHLIRPTGLGNVLAAMEDTAGRRYGMDAVVVWPRLYPVLSEEVRALVDDRRNMLDASARMATTMLITAIASVVLLSSADWWMLLALLPLGVSVLAYLAAVQGGLAYAEAVHVAFDLHRGDLLDRLRMRTPASFSSEHELYEQWSDFWRQGIPFRPDLPYQQRHEDKHKVGT